MFKKAKMPGKLLNLGIACRQPRVEIVNTGWKSMSCFKHAQYKILSSSFRSGQQLILGDRVIIKGEKLGKVAAFNIQPPNHGLTDPSPSPSPHLPSKVLFVTLGSWNMPSWIPYSLAYIWTYQVSHCVYGLLNYI